MESKQDSIEIGHKTSYQTGTADAGGGDDAAQGLARVPDPGDDGGDGGGDAVGVGDVAVPELDRGAAELVDDGGARLVVHVEHGRVAAGAHDGLDGGSAEAGCAVGGGSMYVSGGAVPAMGRDGTGQGGLRDGMEHPIRGCVWVRAEMVEM